jgi:hypothetical protein
MMHDAAAVSIAVGIVFVHLDFSNRDVIKFAIFTLYSCVLLILVQC